MLTQKNYQIVLNNYINDKFAEIATILPTLVANNPASFKCGHAMGYKQALLDLDRFLENIITL